VKTIDEAAEAAFAKMTAPEVQPTSDTPIIAADNEDTPDEDVAGSDTEDGQVDDVDETSDTEQLTDEDESDSHPQGATEIPDDAVELATDTTFVVDINGTPTALTGDELRAGYLRHDDYTKKRQTESAALTEAQEQVATARSEAEAASGATAELEQASKWFEEHNANPSGWIAEIAEAQGDPASATAHLSSAIMQLHEAGLLTPEFSEAFSLGDPSSVTAQVASGTALDQRLSKIEGTLSEKQASEQSETDQQAEIQRIIAEYKAQWASIVEQDELVFTSTEAELKARSELINYAKDSEIHDLEKAWLKMSRDQAKKTASEASDKVKAAKGGGKKGTPSPINRSSTQGSQTPQAKASSIDEAADRAYQKLLSKHA
jgi:hypothetical protein